MIVSLIDLATFLALLPCLVFLVKARGRINFELWWVMAMLVGLSIFISTGNALEFAGITIVFDPYDDYAEMILPLSYGSIFLIFFLTANQRALAESEKRYRVLVENIQLGITQIDKDFRVVVANKAQQELFGKTVEEMRGTNCFEEFEKRDAVCAHCPGRIAMDTGEPAMSEAEGVLDDGQKFSVEIRAFPLKDDDGSIQGFIEVVENVTEKKASQAALEESEQRYERFFRTNRAAMLLIEPTGLKIVDANEAAQKLYGYPPEEFLSMNMFQLNQLPEGDLQSAVSTIIDQGYEKYIFQHQIASGEIRDVEVSTGPITVEGKKLLYSIVHDITDVRRAEEEKRRIEEQLRQTQKVESLGVMAGGIAHDFNNILMSVVGNTELAKLKIDADSPAMSALVKVEASALRASELARQMLAYAGKAELLKEPVNMNSVIEEMSDILKAVIRSNCDLHLDLAPNLVNIRGDSTQLRQVIMNLITNASEAIVDGRGLVTITTKEVDVSPEELVCAQFGDKTVAGRFVCIEVADTGHGIAPEVREKMFDPFFSTKFTGRGLGMAVVAGAVMSHNGFINVDSEPGRGTAIRVSLPVDEGTPDKDDQMRQVEPLENLQGGGTILVVDDEAAVLDVVGGILTHYGFEVLMASSGAGAIDIFREMNESIDLIVLDMAMPQMDGVGTLAEIRKLSPGTKVLMSSGFSKLDTMNKIKNDDKVWFIEKPYTAAKLIGKIRELLRG